MQWLGETRLYCFMNSAVVCQKLEERAVSAMYMEKNMSAWSIARGGDPFPSLRTKGILVIVVPARQRRAVMGDVVDVPLHALQIVLARCLIVRTEDIE